MAAHFDHLVVSVDDLEQAMARWHGVGLNPSPGGRHPGGTVNALVRGPRAAYVELISTAPDADSEAGSAWADRVRAGRGPLGFAVAVDDLESARDALVAAGFRPGQIVPGERALPDGSTVRWRHCQVGEQAFDPELPFLISWDTPMRTGPADGPVIEGVTVEVPDRDRLATMLRVLGFPEEVGSTPGVTFDDGEVRLWLPPTEAEMAAWEPAHSGSATYRVSLRAEDGVGDDAESSAPAIGPTAIGIGLPRGRPEWFDLDGLSVTVHPDLRSHRGHVLLSAVEEHFARRSADLVAWPAPHPERPPLDEEYSRCLNPGRYRIVTARARAWAAALADADLAAAKEHRAGFDLLPRRDGALPLTVTIEGFEGVADNLVQLAVEGSVLARLPDCGCDACDDGSSGLLTALDEAFLHVLDGGVLRIVGRRGREVSTTLDGWSATGSFDRDEPEQWIADARAGRSRHRVIEGEPWL